MHRCDDNINMLAFSNTIHVCTHVKNKESLLDDSRQRTLAGSSTSSAKLNTLSCSTVSDVHNGEVRYGKICTPSTAMCPLCYHFLSYTKFLEGTQVTK